MKHSLKQLPARKRRHLGIIVKRHLEIIVKMLRAAVDAEIVILYGSHARGDCVFL
jgi:predicted nucleotidyltransferase